MSSISGKYCIVGIGNTAFVRNAGRSTLSMVCEAVGAALKDSGLTSKDIDGMVSSGHGDSATTAAVATAMGMRLNFFLDMDGGGGSSESLIAMAASLIEAGVCKTMVVYRGLTGGSGRRIGQKPGDRIDTHFRTQWGWTVPVQWFAIPAMRYLHETGTTTRAFGEIAVTHRYHASLNPKALRREPITLEDHQQSRWIAKPFRLLDCCQETDVAGALIITTRDRAYDLKQRPVYIMNAVGRGGTPNQAWPLCNPVIYESGGQYMRERLFGGAGISLGDLDLVSMYDAFTYEALYQYETWGFCGHGEAGEFVKNGRTRIDGELPTNTSGGLLSEGYIHGLNLILENVRQLRHQADDACPGWREGKHTYDRARGCRQVRDAHLAASLASIEERASGLILRSA